ncbi:hypothetical protein [uncultured Anaerotruncus sp.]|uniref:hypothetical protein n=1 Tax=uncultured Anaerotruncus sp. TaxID=905011 RepID=UPI00280B5E35|nr:hypothetical protein [uncultured Anaerotruncus sp.]
MNKKTTGIVAYITWIGWIIAFFAGDKEGAKFHLNQALVIFLAGIVCSIVAQITIVGAIIGGIASIVVFVFWIMGLVAACKEEEKEVPLLGKIKLLK